MPAEPTDRPLPPQPSIAPAFLSSTPTPIGPPAHRRPAGRRRAGRWALSALLVGVLLVGGGLLRFGASADDRPATAAALAVGSAGSCAAVATTAAHELRGMWLTTVNNIDFPSKPGLSKEKVQAEYRGWLDLAQAQRHNAIFVHVRPSGDAFWPSTYAPWSQWLTGRRDGAGPGWDPLAFMVAEAHARNIEFHAWFNPYRGSQPSGAGNRIDKLPAGHPLRKHPDWAIVYPKSGPSSRLYFDPGNPTVRRFVEDSMLDAVKRYDVDGVHFDDFFYPYPVTGQDFPDAKSFKAHGKGLSKANWRRANVDALVQEMSQRIKALKPWVKFGISPFGIWRNASTDKAGSATKGLQSYDAIYADTRKWVRSQWLDYVVPQLYWHIGFDKADYAVLVPWWSKLVAGTRVQLYVGQADYRVGEKGAWSDPAQLERQLTLNRKHAVLGSVHFSAKQIRANRLGAVTRYRNKHYSRPALLPAMAQLPAAAPGAPQLQSAVRDAAGKVTVSFRAAPGPATASWALYRVDPGAASAALVATGRAAAAPASPVYRAFRSGAPASLPARAVDAAQAATDPSAKPGVAYTYCLSGLDRSGNESAASAPLPVA